MANYNKIAHYIDERHISDLQSRIDQVQASSLDLEAFRKYAGDFGILDKSPAYTWSDEHLRLEAGMDHLKECFQTYVLRKKQCKGSPMELCALEKYYNAGDVLSEAITAFDEEINRESVHLATQLEAAAAYGARFGQAGNSPFPLPSPGHGVVADASTVMDKDSSSVNADQNVASDQLILGYDTSICEVSTVSIDMVSPKCDSASREVVVVPAQNVPSPCIFA